MSVIFPGTPGANTSSGDKNSTPDELLSKADIADRDNKLKTELLNSDSSIRDDVTSFLKDFALNSQAALGGKLDPRSYDFNQGGSFEPIEGIYKALSALTLKTVKGFNGNTKPSSSAGTLEMFPVKSGFFHVSLEMSVKITLTDGDTDPFDISDTIVVLHVYDKDTGDQKFVRGFGAEAVNDPGTTDSGIGQIGFSSVFKMKANHKHQIEVNDGVGGSQRMGTLEVLDGAFSVQRITEPGDVPSTV